MVREIFNDVLGPVMRGPSSSHTAGPARIGKWMSGLIGEVANVTFEISKSGSYASMFHSQGSDRGFLGGLLGYEPDAEELIAIPQILRQRKVDYSVILLEQAFAHPNFARITARDRRGCVAVTESTSIGGGAIRIHSVNHRETEITGTFYELLIFTQSPEECRLPYFEGIMQITKGPGLVNAKLVCKPPQAWLDRVRDSFPETYLIAPVLPCTIICQNDDDIPFMGMHFSGLHCIFDECCCILP